MIIWDPEGSENPHPITYIGDPRMVKVLAPEAEDIYPDFFKRFRDAGLRVGCCLRPTQVYFNEKEKNWYHGTGRMGGDYWAESYHDGCKQNGGAPGFSIMKCLWPGPDGAEPSARFEAMVEGLQELEARIFVEQALDRGILSTEQGKRVTEQLGRHFKGTFAVGLDWQARSKAMYQLASEVARTVGPNVAESDRKSLEKSEKSSR